MFGRKKQEEPADFESRRALRRQRRKRERRRHILLFIAAICTVLLLFLLVSQIKEKIEERRLLKARNESFVGAPPFEVDLLDVNEYSRPGTPGGYSGGGTDCLSGTDASPVCGYAGGGGR